MGEVEDYQEDGWVGRGWVKAGPKKIGKNMTRRKMVDWSKASTNDVVCTLHGKRESGV